MSVYVVTECSFASASCFINCFERKPINNRENVNQVLLIIGGVKVLSYVFLLEEEGEGKNRK
jgi:hypothetical protein